MKKRKTNGFAIASLIFGILSFMPFFNYFSQILAIVFGIIGYKRTKKGYGGKGLAIAGITLGIISFLLIVLAAIVMTWGTAYIRTTT